MSSNSSKSSYKHQTYLYTITGQKTTCPCRPTRPSQVTNIKISIHNHRPEDNSSVSSNLSKWSYKHQTYQYTITGQKTTCPCRPTRPSHFTHIKHIYTKSQARRQLVRVVQLVQVKSEEKYTFKHFYTQSQARGQLVRVVQLVQVMLQTSNISIQNHRPEDN